MLYVYLTLKISYHDDCILLKKVFLQSQHCIPYIENKIIKINLIFFV
jgi:hypothetical protein